MNELISVIMGIYNCENTLAESIDSILAQTYTNWNLIMCDDGSTDNTYAIALRYKEKYPGKIILLKNDANYGLNYTLNICLQYANGGYIARQDGDDISKKIRFQKELDFLMNHPQYDIVSCAMEYFDENGIWNIGKVIKNPQTKDFVSGTPFCHAPCMVKASAYEAVAGYTVMDKLLRVEDYHLWIKMYAQGYLGYNLAEPLYYMRDDRDAVSRRKYKYRVNEFRVKCFAIKTFCLPLRSYIVALKPLFVGLLPKILYVVIRKMRIRSVD